MLLSKGTQGLPDSLVLCQGIQDWTLRLEVLETLGNRYVARADWEKVEQTLACLGEMAPKMGAAALPHDSLIRSALATLIKTDPPRARKLALSLLSLQERKKYQKLLDPAGGH
jgi:hypothetical protein